MQPFRAQRLDARLAGTALALAVLTLLAFWYQHGLPYIVFISRSTAVAQSIAACTAGAAVRLSGSFQEADASILTLEDYAQRFHQHELGTFIVSNAPPTTLVWRVTMHGSRQFLEGPPPAQSPQPATREATAPMPVVTGECEVLVHATTGVILRMSM